MLALGSYAVGSHFYFFPSGNTFTKDAANSTVSATAATSSAKPGSTDTGWIDFGTIEEFKTKPASGTAVEIWKPSPGRLRLQKKKMLKEKVGFSFTVQELSQLAMEIIYKGAKGMTTQFTPLEGTDKEGWAKIQQYDETDTLLFTGDLWVCINPSGDVDFGGGDIVKPAFEVDMLFSTLNTCTL